MTMSNVRPGSNARRSPGQASRIETNHLEMELDHDTGEMHGRVLRGMFAGRDLSTLSPADLGLLWQDCRHTDHQSAQLVEAYLDRIHPTWREDMARGESDMNRGPNRWPSIVSTPACPVRSRKSRLENARSVSLGRDMDGSV